MWDQKLGRKLKSKKALSYSIGHNFSQILMKYGQNV